MFLKDELTPHPPRGLFKLQKISPPWGLPAGRQGFRGKNKRNVLQNDLI
jgi:hypothetical protein